MEKRLFNKLGFETSLLGLGCMRFPQKNGKIDLLETEKLVDACMAGGINYFDTAYVYGDGDSENAVKRTLVERYPRERFYLANKLPMWLIPEGHTPQELLETSLKRTGVTYFDQYLLHNLNQENWEICKKENLVDFIFAKKAAGAVRNAGFSFHDTPEVLCRIAERTQIRAPGLNGQPGEPGKTPKTPQVQQKSVEANPKKKKKIAAQ